MFLGEVRSLTGRSGEVCRIRGEYREGETDLSGEARPR